MNKEVIVQLALLLIVLVGGYWLCKAIDFYYEKKKGFRPDPKKEYTDEQIQDLREMRKLTWLHGKLGNSLVVYVDGKPFTRLYVNQRAEKLRDKFHKAGFSAQDVTKGILALRHNGYPPENGF